MGVLNTSKEVGTKVYKVVGTRVRRGDGIHISKGAKTEVMGTVALNSGGITLRIGQVLFVRE